MKLTNRKAALRDIGILQEIEADATPSNLYVYDNRHFYLDGQENRGEMILVLADGHPVGMGQFSLLPDGSGWLECLRVKKEFQHQGIGRQIYARYLELAEEYHCPSLAMYTGPKNLASRTLAEKNGFSLAGSFLQQNLSLAGRSFADPGEWKQVSDPDRILALLSRQASSWGSFLSLNNTYFHADSAFAAYVGKKGMVCSDGENTVILGTRMLPERGNWLVLAEGDLRRCLTFAAAETAARGLPQLSAVFGSDRQDLAEGMEAFGFTEAGERIVMERKGSTQIRKEKKTL